MEFHEGDIVSGRGIRVGCYAGEEVINGVTYMKVFDLNANANYYVPMDRIEDLRKLPSKEIVQKNLKMFGNLKLVDDGELEGSRYKYFKCKLEKVDFKQTMEVLHDLSALKIKKDINSSERKLLQDLKEKMLTEIAYVLNCETDELEELIDLKKLTA